MSDGSHPPNPDESRSRSSRAHDSQLVRVKHAAHTGRDRTLRQRPSRSARKSPRSWASLAVMGIAILLGTGLIGGGAWVGIQLMIDPNALSWVNRFLPGSAQLPGSTLAPAQTLAEIQAEIRALGLLPGKPLQLRVGGVLGGRTDLLFPVYLKQPACQYQCEPIVELRVYRADGPFQLPGQEKRYRLANQVAVQGIEAALALAPLLAEKAAAGDASRLLPVTDLQLFSGSVPAEGIWLSLSGTRSQENPPLAYGHIVQYDPAQMTLSLPVQWSSTDGNLPRWQQVTGDKTPELVTNQSMGMEPKFQLAQLQSVVAAGQVGQLQPISLMVPALDHPAYRAAIRLARGGLWSPALASLQTLKGTANASWSPAAQAQLDFIRLHAEVTAAQADQTWVSTNQKVLALLIDGRWSEALKAFAANAVEAEDAIALLQSSEPLWQRVEVALAVNSKNPDIRVWGALILGAKQTPAQAIAWLRQQPGTTSATVAKANQLLQRQKTASAIATVPDHPSQIIGMAHPLGQVNPSGWLNPQPQTKLVLDSQQRWYQIQVTRFHDGQRWQQAPFQLTKAKTGPYLWQLLGFAADDRLQILLWTGNEQHAIAATVKAMRLQRGQLWLLAAADALPNGVSPASSTLPRPLAFSNAALQWQTPETVSLAQLAQDQPQQVSALFSLLWRELQRGQILAETYNPSIEERFQKLGFLTVQRLDLTGNQELDALIVVDGDRLAELRSTLSETQAGSHSSPVPRTVIFSSGGRLLYSEFSRDAGNALVGVVALEGSVLPALAISSPQQYQLKQWSAARQRFE